MTDTVNYNDTLNYKVLARKYRPQTLNDLIGQDGLVRTLRNALDQGRIAHSFILTGVRGVGKTTTARIIAKGLNCVGLDGSGGPTVNPCGGCANCTAIMEDRHVDVLEMDAASRTGVDDIREIIEGVRYKPVSARYKIYIIDEVHMLSRNAFNALLKTLEEPPDNVKFVFATTEIRKVPVTVLSRCQRFDLQRINNSDLISLFTTICEKEATKADNQALAILAKAADGSARDGLSLLDQAIALSSGEITQQLIHDMIGSTDDSEILDLFEYLIRGKLPEVLEKVRGMYGRGIDPLAIVQDLLDATHLITRLKVAPQATGRDIAESEIEKVTIFARGLRMSHLGRIWQMMLKGIDEVQQAPSPLAALEMLLIRLVYLADNPSGPDSIKTTDENRSQTEVKAVPKTPSDRELKSMLSSAKKDLSIKEMEEPQQIPDPDLSPIPGTFEEIVSLFSLKREAVLHAQLTQYVRPIRVEPGLLEMSAVDQVDEAIASRLAKLLTAWTQIPWDVSLSNKKGDITVVEKEIAQADAIKEKALSNPVVAAVLENFPGSSIESVHPASISAQSMPERLSNKLKSNNKKS